MSADVTTVSCDTSASERAGLWRRIGAIVYDTLPVLALLIIGTFPFLPFIGNRVLVPREVGALAYVYWFGEMLIVVLFFGYFWTTRGQTIGMLAWRLKLQRTDGSLPQWQDAIIRVATLAALLAPSVAGYWILWGHWTDLHARQIAMYASLLPVASAYLWMFVDPQRRALHDRLSGTHVIVTPKVKR